MSASQKEIEEKLALISKECDKGPTGPFDFRCFRKRAQVFVTQYGVGVAMAALEGLGEKSGGIAGKISCHDMGHLVGELGFEVERDLGKTILECGRGCGFGCTHGAAVGALFKEPSLLDNLASVCKRFEASSFPGQELTACQHGLGHGLSEITNRDIVQALLLCDRLGDRAASEACATGVFMDMIEGPILDREGSLLKLPDDIPSFCKTLPGMYADICLINVGGYEYKRSGNLQKSFQLCETIPPNLSRNCASDLGTDFHFMFQGNAQKVWEACDSGKQNQKEPCIEGAIISGLVTDPNGNISIELCRTVTKEFQEICFAYLGKSIGQIHGEPERKNFCDKLGLPYQEFCFDTQ